MINTFLTSFKLENTYKVNTIIHSLKSVPIIKKIIPYDLYNNKGIKLFGLIINIIKEVFTLYIGKIFYLLFLTILPVLFYNNNNYGNTFLTIIVFLSIIGGIVNKNILEASYEKYYAIVLMKMNAQKYAISNFFYFLLKTFIGFIPLILFICLIFDLPFLIGLLLPLFIVMTKIIGLSIDLLKYDKTGNYTELLNEKKDELAIVIILLICAYILPIFKIVISTKIFFIIFLIFLVISIFSLIKILKFNKYKQIYKKILTAERIFFSTSSEYNEAVKEKIKKSIEYDQDFQSTKKDFSFFHEIFVKRHNKILTKTIKTQSIITLLVFITIIIVINIFPNLKENINSMMLNYLPYFVFLMYILNRGETLTQAMFLNCDHSMLTYRIYRRPKVILGVFKERLKTLISYNLIPAFIIALGLPLLLFLTGGTNNILNYFVLFISIICMSIFFSVHYLVIYYLLQPYNVQTEVKNSTFHAVQSATYIVCYLMTELHFPTMIFGIVTIIFSILYIVISLILVYKMAPKTFKLRI